MIFTGIDGEKSYSVEYSRLKRKWRPATEDDVLKLLSSYSLSPESVYRSESGVEVKLKEVRWSLIPDLVRDLERRFELVSLSAVDNTGKGVFELRFVVR